MSNRWVTRPGGAFNTYHLLAEDQGDDCALLALCGLSFPFKAKVGRLKIVASIPRGKRECERCKARDGRPSPKIVHREAPLEGDEPWAVRTSTASPGWYAHVRRYPGTHQFWDPTSTHSNISLPPLTWEEYREVLDAAEAHARRLIESR